MSQSKNQETLCVPWCSIVVSLSPSTPKIFIPFIGVGNINGNDRDLICFSIFRSHHMKRAFALEAQDQPAGFGHL